MKRLNSFIFIGLLLTAAAPAAQAQQTNDLERIHVANQQFATAIGARDINAMDKVWAHENPRSSDR